MILLFSYKQELDRKLETEECLIFENSFIKKLNFIGIAPNVQGQEEVNVIAKGELKQKIF